MICLDVEYTLVDERIGGRRMKNPIQYQRQMALQLHCGIHAFCFVVTFICMLFLRFEVGFLEVLALIIPLIGVLALFLNSNLGKGRRVMKECYLCASAASVLSLFLLSQVLMQFCCNYWFGGLLYFLFTGAALAGLAYFIFLGDMQFLSKCLTPIALVGSIVIGLLVAIVIYKFFIAYWFNAGFILFLSYGLWVLNLVLTIFICLDLRILFLKGR